jgi:hypothetical protein
VHCFSSWTHFNTWSFDSIQQLFSESEASAHLKSVFALLSQTSLRFEIFEIKPFKGNKKSNNVYVIQMKDCSTIRKWQSFLMHLSIYTDDWEILLSKSKPLKSSMSVMKLNCWSIIFFQFSYFCQNQEAVDSVMHIFLSRLKKLNAVL